MDPVSNLEYSIKESSPEIYSTLLSLDSNIFDTMFNMSDALSALPSELHIFDSESDIQACKRKSKDTSFVCGTPLTIELKAPTSPATLLTEESLTYLNQAQPYIVEISDAYGERPSLIKSIVRICFYQERLQINESRHLAAWQAHHEGVRMLDIDVGDCYNCQYVYADPDNVNAVVCIWHSSAPCSISLKAYCVSTEFTAKKHGGEKGVPFRIQVDSFRESDNAHIYSASCQVKVFKPKGADRKNRTDRAKIDKLIKVEQQQYRSAASTTFLEEVAYCSISRLALDDSVSLTATLEDCLSSGSQYQQPPSLPAHLLSSTAVRDMTSASSLAPSFLAQCKRSAQDDEGLHAGLRKISLVGKKNTRQATAPVPLLPPPIKNGRLFGLQTSGDSNRDDSTAASEVSIDALLFSQCEISEHRVCTSSFQPIFSTPSTTATSTSASGGIFKLPQALLSSSVPSQKRSTTPGDEKSPCPGICSCCGKACSSSTTSGNLNSEVSLERNVKRLRSKRQSMRFSRVAPNGHGQAEISCVPCTTSDYSSHTLDDDNETAVGQRRPSTSSETSQPIPSDKSSKPPSQTKSEAEDDEEEAAAVVEDVGEEGDDESEEGTANSCSPLMLPLVPCSTTASTNVAALSAAATLSMGRRTSRSLVVSSARRARVSFRADMPRAAVSNWLRASGFGSLRSKFAKFTGADMLRLSRRDLILLCGTVDGIRLSNAMLQKPPRATCTIFVRKDSESVFQAIYLYQQTELELRLRLSSFLNLINPPQNISIILMKSPNFHVAVNDEMVAYFENQSSFSVCVSELSAEMATFVLKKL